jgi:voltage-gated potassium channel
MEFLRPAIAAALLVACSLWIQCAGMATLISWGLSYLAHKQRLRLVHSTILIVRVTSLIIGLHLAQILAWAAFYRWMCFPRWGFAFYFSIASYSTLGAGDPVLPTSWRTLGPVEAVTGILMCGLSVSLLFAVVTRLVDRVVRSSPNPGGVAESRMHSLPVPRTQLCANDVRKT